MSTSKGKDKNYFEALMEELIELETQVDAEPDGRTCYPRLAGGLQAHLKMLAGMPKAKHEEHLKWWINYHKKTLQQKANEPAPIDLSPEEYKLDIERARNIEGPPEYRHFLGFMSATDLVAYLNTTRGPLHRASAKQQQQEPPA